MPNIPRPEPENKSEPPVDIEEYLKQYQHIFTKLPRNPIKQMFITFSNSTVDKHEFRDYLLVFKPTFYKISQETHQSGKPHLHAVIKFKNKYSIKHIKKELAKKYPYDFLRINVEAARSIPRSLAYLSKEDTAPLTTGSYEETRKPQQNWLNKFARDIGYRDVEDAVRAHHEEKLEKAELCTKVKQHIDWLMKYPDYQLSWRSEKIYKKLLSDIWIPKDDITFFLKDINFKHK